MPPHADAIIAANPDDGEARARAARAFARLAQSPRPRILLVTHARGGGVARHVRELSALLASKAEVLVLRPWRRSFVQLEEANDAGGAKLWFHAADDWPALVSLLQGLGLARVHIHHVQGLPERVLDLGREVGCPWDVTVHDYYPACPQYQLTDASGRYCGEPDEAGCTRCLAATPAQWPKGIAEWRSAFARLLGEAARVIAPSRDAADRIERHFPGVKPLVWPHPAAATRPQRQVKVLVLGGLSPSKGMAVLAACARDAKRRALALRFRVVGHIAWPTDEERLPLSFTGEFPEGELGALIEQERGDAILFPAQWPETYSYTLDDAVASGLPILAFALGAFAERLEGMPQARTIAWDSAPHAINDALLAMASPADGRPAPGSIAPAMTAGDYAERYLQEVTPPPVSGPAPAVAPPGRTAPPEEPLPQATLVELFDDGVRAGNGRSLAELRARMRDADQAVQEARRLAQVGERLGAAEAREVDHRQEQAALQGELAKREAEAKAARARVADLEASTSWRLTAPLRALARLFRS